MLLSRVRRSVVERELARDRERILVAVSGGADSMALAHVLGRLALERRWSLLVVSIDHGLRPEAAEEVAFVGRFSESLGLPFHSLRLTLEKGPSLQDRARKERYRVLGELAEEHRASRIAVGHTQDDQAETVLARLLRGPGVGGLAGIEPRRADGVIRPLIDCRRFEVEAYLRRHGVGWIEDPSNRDEAFLRVRIRQRLLPLLMEEDPRLIEHWALLADDARSYEELVSAEASELLARARHDGALDREILRDASDALRLGALRLWLAGYGIGRAHLQALDQLLSQGRGAVLLPGGRSVSLVEGRLTVVDSAGLRVRGRQLGKKG